MRIAQLLGTLDVLFADIEQPDARVREPVQIARQHRAHRRELDQVVGRAVGIGAEIEHHRVPVHRGDGRHDRRAVHPIDHPEHEAGGRKQRAGVAGAHARGSVSRFHEVDRDPHGGVLLATDRVLRTLVHAHDLAGLHEPAALRHASRGKERADGVGASDEDQLERGFTSQDVEGCGHGHGGAVVTAHGVHGNAERSRH